MIKGSKVGLTAIEREDLKRLAEWRNSSALKKHFREYRELNMDMQESWFEQTVVKGTRSIMFAIRKLQDKTLIGCCGLVYIDWICRRAELSVYIGENEAYIDEQGYAEEACNLILRYAFNDLGLHKVWVEIYEFDKKKGRLFVKLGFHKDGVLRDNYMWDGKWWDSHILSLIESEFRQARS